MLYTAKVSNVSDGKLAYRTGPSTSSKYKTAGYYELGKTIKIVRVKGDWVQAANGYWTLSREDDTEYLITKKVYPLQPEL